MIFRTSLSVGYVCIHSLQGIAIIKRTSPHSQAHLINMSAIHRRNDEIHGSADFVTADPWRISKQDTLLRLTGGLEAQNARCPLFLHQVVFDEKNTTLLKGNRADTVTVMDV